MPDVKTASGKCARDIMARKLITVRPEVDVAYGIRLLLKRGISGVPVADGEGRYHGVFSEKCCLRILTSAAARLEDPSRPAPRAREFMTTRLFALRPEQDVFQAIAALLKNRVSGAPVTETSGTFLGSFSEKTSMQVLIDSVYDQVPSGEVGSFMDPQRGRIIDEETDLLAVARIFVETPYRRLPVVKEGRVLGQISRRDVLRSSRILETIVLHGAGSDDEEASPGSAPTRRLTDDGLPATDVAAFMDTTARTIDEDLDLLSIANIFLTTPYRRLPVLRGEKVVGQVSRRDVLAAAYQLSDLPNPNPSESGILYLSATLDRDQMPAM